MNISKKLAIGAAMATAVATPAAAATTVYSTVYQSTQLGFGSSGTPTVGQTFWAPNDALLSWTYTTSSSNPTGVRFVVRAWDALTKKAVGPTLYSATTATVAYELTAGYYLSMYSHTWSNINLALTPGMMYAAFITTEGALTPDDSFYLALAGTPTAPSGEQLHGQIYHSGYSPDLNVGWSYLNGRQAHLSAEFGSLVVAVPETATWAMVIIGFGVIGAGLRRQRPAVTVPA